MSVYTEFYPGGWKDLPDTSTPAIAAALQHMETAIAAASPAAQQQTLSTSQGSWSASTSVTLLQVLFSAAGRLRLYNSSAARTADQARAAGVLPTAIGILYEYVADTNNADTIPVGVYVGSGKTIYWQLDGGPTVTVEWVQAAQ